MSSHDDLVNLPADDYILRLMHDYRDAPDEEVARQLALFFKAAWASGYAPMISNPALLPESARQGIACPGDGADP